VFIADDDEQLRSLLRLLLEAELDLTVVGDASSGSGALRALATGEPPDVLLVDVNMPATDTGDVLRRAFAMHPAMEIIVYSGEDEATARRRIGKTCPYEYVTKGAPEDLLVALRDSGAMAG
jgi:DNA-binding NarL/FixJ family response regulator